MLLREKAGAVYSQRASAIIMEMNKPMRKVNLMVEPTNRCDLRCPTCFSHQDGRDKKDMSLDDFKSLIRENVQGINHLSLYNYGEPLLNRSLGAMIRYAKQAGVSYVKMATNGMCLTSRKAHMLVASGLDGISISLDGASDSTYSQFRVGGDFRTVVKNIERLVKVRDLAGSPLVIELQFIIMAHNEHERCAIEALARKLKVDVLRLKTVLIKKAIWRYLLPKDKRYCRYAGVDPCKTCLKPKDELVINSDGTVIPCCYIVGKDIKKYSFGNITEHPLREIMQSGAYIKFLKNCMSDKRKNECCKGCDEGNLELDHKVIRLRKGKRTRGVL
jgi:radical SAM protein with 4Fe4S-binding SPASM domain